MAYDFTVRTKQDLIAAVREYGILPYFATSIPGFSLEEHCSPWVLFNDTEENTWEWKGPVIRETGCAYGKFFEKKAAYVRRDLFLDLANYRRDGYDFDARYDDGLAKFQDKQLYDLIDENAPVLSKVLRQSGGYATAAAGRRPRAKRALTPPSPACRSSATSSSATLSTPPTKRATAGAGAWPSTPPPKSSWAKPSANRSTSAAPRSPTRGCWSTWPGSSPGRRKRT